MVYFDNNATTPIGEGPLSVLKCALEEDWANPSAPYSLASRVRAKVEIVREKLASYFHFKPDEVTFTSGLPSPIMQFLPTQLFLDLIKVKPHIA